MTSTEVLLELIKSRAKSIELKTCMHLDIISQVLAEGYDPDKHPKGPDGRWIVKDQPIPGEKPLAIKESVPEAEEKRDPSSKDQLQKDIEDIKKKLKEVSTALADLPDKDQKEISNVLKSDNVQSASDSVSSTFDEMHPEAGVAYKKTTSEINKRLSQGIESVSKIISDAPFFISAAAETAIDHPLFAMIGAAGAVAAVGGGALCMANATLPAMFGIAPGIAGVEAYLAKKTILEITKAITKGAVNQISFEAGRDIMEKGLKLMSISTDAYKKEINRRIQNKKTRTYFADSRR
ncbi:MAG: hypothetical protein WBB28_01285 [Crinalium sp.]